MDQFSPIQCQRCGAPLPPDALVCTRCGLLVHSDRLRALAQNAIEIETTNPAAAVPIWRDILSLLPRESQQYQEVRGHIGQLTGDPSLAPQRDILNYDHRVRPQETFARAAFKTVGSLIVSAWIYSWYWGWAFAVGFVLLIFVHEMGHVIAIKYYKLRAGPPLFIPFMGALIDLRDPPPDAKVEAVVGIGGPILGTIGALVCYWTSTIDSQFGILMLELAFFGFMLNLFNLLPIPPLDGGRVTAALSPKLWLLGVAAMVAWILRIVQTTGRFPWLLILILVIAFPRVWATIKMRSRLGHYYNISKRATWTIGLAYGGLALVLAYFFVEALQKLRHMELAPF